MAEIINLKLYRWLREQKRKQTTKKWFLRIEEQMEKEQKEWGEYRYRKIEAYKKKGIDVIPYTNFFPYGDIYLKGRNPFNEYSNINEKIVTIIGTRKPTEDGIAKAKEVTQFMLKHYKGWVAVANPSKRDIENNEPSIGANLVFNSGDKEDIKKMLQLSYKNMGNLERLFCFDACDEILTYLNNKG